MHMLEAIEDEQERQEALRSKLWQLYQDYQDLGLRDPKALYQLKQDQPAICKAVEGVLLVHDRHDWDTQGRQQWRERRGGAGSMK